MGRTPKPIDWHIVEKKMECGCKAEEIAACFHIAVKNFYARFEEYYNDKFVNIVSRYHGIGKSSIREVQYEKAIEGNTQMLLLLGEEWLEQRKQKDKDKIPLEKIQELEENIIELLKENRLLKQNASQRETGTELQRSDSTI